jgi:hypothetical protein
MHRDSLSAEQNAQGSGAGCLGGSTLLVSNGDDFHSSLPFTVITMLKGICQSPFFRHYGIAKMLAFPAIWHRGCFGHEAGSFGSARFFDRMQFSDNFGKGLSMKWPTIEIETNAGLQKAIAPYIISASRSTDIPAFHAQWFFNRLKGGYCKWLNPFNHRTVYVSFKHARAFVFWTKNASPMLPFLSELDRRGLVYYFQFTINDYEAENLEPNVPPLMERLDTFKRLSEMLGKERVIWRYDPLLLTDSLSVDDLMAKVERIGREIHPYTEKLVFSFADIAGYAKVQKNLERSGVHFREFDASTMTAFAAKLSRLLADWKILGCTCAESIDLSTYGIGHNRCIDGDLLLRISHNDRELLHAFGVNHAHDASLLPIIALDHNHLKDKGQRKACGCIVSKDIGQYNTCPHLCHYCYANTSPTIVKNNMKDIAAEGEAIVTNRLK